MIEHLQNLNKRSIACAACSLVLCTGLSLPVNFDSAYAVTAAEKQAEADQAKDKMNELYDVAEQKSEAYNDAVVARDEAKSAQKEAESKVDEAKKEIASETKKIEGYQEQLGNRARSMYRSGGNDFIDVLLGSSSFEEFATSWTLLETLNENDAELVSETKEARTKLESAKKELDEQAAEAKKQSEEATKQAAAAKAAKSEAAAAASKAESSYKKLSKEAKKLLAEEKAEEERKAKEAAAAAKAEQEAAAKAEREAAQNASSNSTVVSRAYAQLGKSYVWGATGMSTFDCSGLVGYCLRGTTGRWMTSSTACGWTKVSNPQPGDVCVRSGHVGIYIGNGMMIHAPHTGDVVKISPVPSNMWYVRY
ncbi:MAG: NlpC/P60 family protein [Coriobacteriia bacterium]|nr:NlpC/P60 family protein [Coriobacteriia bacterium]